MWKSNRMKTLSDRFRKSALVVLVLSLVVLLWMVRTKELPAEWGMPFAGLVLFMMMAPALIANWSSWLWSKREEKWREAHRTPFHIAEAISARPFGERHYSDDADDLFRMLLDSEEGAGPYSPANMEHTVRQVAMLYANDGLNGFTELCMLEDVEFIDGEWRWSEELWQEVWQHWLEKEPVGPWWQRLNGRWDPMAAAW
jgi:hypothetical protein